MTSLCSSPTAVLFSGVGFGAIIDLYGCRVVALAGTLVLTLGLVTSALVNSIFSLFITFGIIGGEDHLFR